MQKCFNCGELNKSSKCVSCGYEFDFKFMCPNLQSTLCLITKKFCKHVNNFNICDILNVE